VDHHTVAIGRRHRKLPSRNVQYAADVFHPVQGEEDLVSQGYKCPNLGEEIADFDFHIDHADRVYVDPSAMVTLRRGAGMSFRLSR
jgi:hypothetical protein